MTQSTYFIQVKNVLKVLQGYCKGIRLLLVMLLTLSVSAEMWAEDYSATHTSNVTFTAGTNGSSAKVIINSTEYDAMKLGTGSKVGTMTFTIPVGTTKIHLHVAGWNGKNTKFNISAGNGVTLATTSITSTADAGISNNSPFTISSTSRVTSDYYKVIDINSGATTSETTITITTISTGYRAVIWGVNAETSSSGGGDPVDPTITFFDGEYTVGGAALNLSTLLTTNSTGAVTYSVTNAGTTGATVNGTSFTATAAGTCTVQASQAATATHNAATATATITVTAPAGGGGDDDADTWTLVKNVNDLAAGDQVVIAASGSDYALSTTQNNNNRGQAAVTKNGETITFGNDVQVLTLQTGYVNGTLAFYTGNGYLHAASSSSNYLRTETTLSNNSSWTITITNTGIATIKAQGTYTKNWLRYNSSSSIFSCYSSGQGDVSIYKKGGSGGGGSTPDPDPIPVTSVSLDKTSHTMNEGETVTLTATVTPNNADDQTVSWKSSDDAIAKVNNTNGVVTAVSPGNATITVTTTDGGKTATCAITVKPLPTVEGTWTLVTNAANLKAGDHIVIAAAESNFALSTTQNDNNRGQAAVTKNGNNITFTEFTQILTLEAGTVDNTLAFNTGSGYLYAASSSNNNLKTQSTNNENSSWSISIAEGIAEVKAQGTNTRNWLRYNSTNSIFSCYGSGQGDVVIYKKAIPTLTVDQTSLAFGNVTANSNKEMTFTLTGSALTANAALVLSGTNAGMFSVSPTSVTPIAGSINQIVTITYKPTAIGNHTATLTISSTDAESKTVALSGTGVQQTYTITYNTNGGDAIAATSGTTLPNPLPTPTRQHYTFLGWYTDESRTQSAIAGATIDADITLYAKWEQQSKYTVNWYVNGNKEHTQEDYAGSTLTDIPNLNDYECGGKVFVGWTTKTSYEHATDAPDDLITNTTGMTIPENGKDYYAVFAKETMTEDVISEEVTSVLSFANKSQRTSYSENQQVWEQNEITLTNDKEKSTTAVGDYAYPARFYKNSKITITFSSNMTKILFLCSGAEYAEALKNSIDENATIIGSNVTVTLSEPRKSFVINALSGGQVRMNSLAVSYMKTTIGGTIATYSEYNTQCTTVSTTYEIIIADDIQNGTITADKSNAAEGEIVTLVATPNEGYTFGSWIVTDAGSDVITVTDNKFTMPVSNVTVSATFTEVPKASITLSELAVTTTDNTTYYVGAQYTLPTISSQSCDGKQLVGWSTVEVAETDTKPTENYYELGAEVTLVETQTFYAVFAAGSSGGGEETTVDLSISSYASAKGWTNATQYATVDIDGKITVTAAGGGNTGKYYTSGADWRLYESEDATLTISANECSINKIKITYTNSNNGILTDGVTQITSNTEVIVNAESITFGTTHSSGSESKGQVRITAISVTFLGSSATYTAYTTSCVPTYSITYDFAGGTDSHCSNTSVPQGDTYTICDEEPAQEGYTFQGWSDGTSTYDAGETITPTGDVTLTAVWKANTYTVTWNNNGDTDEVTYNHGDALVVPIAPASCDGVKEFVGWTTHSGYYHATTAPDDLFTTKTTPVTATATYYAVFATPPTTGGGGSIETTDDVLTRETTGVTEGSTNYASWSGKTATSSAVYAGNSAGSNNAIQLRSNNSNSGIVTTTSGGKITHVEVEWESATATDRKLDIYGRNVAYSAATDLYSTGTQGTKLGSITCGTSTELEITGDYEYIGLRSNSGAMYLTSITITWSSAGGSSSHTDYTTTCQEVTGIALSGSYPTTFIQFDAFSFAGGIVTATLENGTTQDVTELATFSGYNMDEVGVQTVTVTYMGQTAKYEITINQSDRWRLTWNVSGKTNTGASPIYVQKGNAIGELPTPEVPDACAGKTFMGWTTSNIVPSDGIGIEYITSATKPTDNTTYYAVFATINNFSIQKPIDQITSETNVVIVAVSSMDANGTAGKAISSRATDDTHNLQGDDVTIVDEHINTPHSTCIWTVEKVDGKYRFSQNGKYLNGVIDGKYSNLKYLETKDSWTLTPAASGMTMTYNMKSTNASTDYVEWYNGKFTIHDEVNNNGAFDMQFFVTANADGDADITDYTTGCAEYTITYYGFTGGYSTSSTSDGTIVLPVNSYITIPNCGDVVKDPTTLGRKFLDVWMTEPHGGHSFKPGDTFVLTQDTTLYAQWKLETTGDVITLPTDVEDLAGTDIYVYGGTTLNIQPGTTTINTLILRGGIQSDGSYKMPNVWVPEGATLVRNNNKIYLDLTINAMNWYPFAVPFETKNTSDIHYLHPDMKSAAKYSKHFDIKTYDGARRADVGEDKANNWVRLKRHTAEEPVSFKPGVGYIISAMAYPGTDTATIRIPMTVPNKWFKNGEQTVVGSTVRNTIAVTAHTGAAATEHQRHAGWNFVANPYLTNFAGNNVANDGGLDYINGAIDIEGGYTYGGENVPYVTVPAYDFSYYEQYKLSDVKLSPEWSFFVQVRTSGTMNFTTEGRQHAPATIRANSANAKPSFDANIVILNENANEADHTGLVINDRYTIAYEIGGDLEKMFGSANRTALYTLSNNIRLAYNALAWDDATQPIPLGYRAEQAGEYTIQLTNPNEIIDVESIVIKDNYNNVTTNLLISDYTFYTEQVQDDERFVIYIVPKQNTTTNLMDMVDKTETKKVIFNNHLYIIHNGCIYDGVGKTIKNK